VVTPGWYDLRALPAQLPLPARLDGLRCLDVGTFDGFWAFELERRGASEVMAVDLLDPLGWDWPAGSVPDTVEAIGQRKRGGAGFELAAAALGGAQRLRPRNRKGVRELLGTPRGGRPQRHRPHAGLDPRRRARHRPGRRRRDRSGRLDSQLTDRLDAIITQTLYPAVCAVADRTELLFETFVKSNRLALMWAMPFGLGLALFAPDLVASCSASAGSGQPS